LLSIQKLQEETVQKQSIEREKIRDRENERERMRKREGERERGHHEEAVDKEVEGECWTSPARVLEERECIG
jgi:hypothetical protein